MFIKIEFDSDTPIYEQLRKQIIIGIANGELEPGEKLPSVRQLSGDIGINMHTVNKTYNILKDEGYLTIDRRKGAVIRKNFPIPKENHLKILKNELKFIIADSKNRGITKKDFCKICSDLYNDFKKN